MQTGYGIISWTCGHRRGESIDVQLRELFIVLRDAWRLVAAAALVVVGAAAVVTMATTPSYSAYSRIYLTVSRAADPTRGDPGGVTPVRNSDLKTLADQLYTPIVLEPLRAAAVPAGRPFGVTVFVPDTNAWMDVTASSSDPQVAADVANSTGPVLAQVATKFSPLLSQPADSVASVVITPAVVPGAPSSPDVRRNIMLGLLAGLALGVGLALIRHALDTKVRGEGDLKLASDRPVLAQVPHEPAAAGARLLFEEDPHGIHAESIRRLRTNLMFVDVTTGKHSFVVTSSMPGEGKTTTIVNLARSLAESGSRVILVDGDLRNPSVAKALGLESGIGLTTVLLGRASLAEAIQPWGDSGLSVLAAGQIPPNPSELLGSRPMVELVEKLSTDFDFVLIDSPPLVPVIDAVLLQQLTGGLVLVVAAERTRKRDLATALTSLRTVDVEPAGLVLNFVPMGGSDPYRYGYYRYDRSRSSRSQGRRRAGQRVRADARQH